MMEVDFVESELDVVEAELKQFEKEYNKLLEIFVDNKFARHHIQKKIKEKQVELNSLKYERIN